MLNIGTPELLLILVVALLVVGPKRLPEVGRAVGRGLRAFRQAQDEVQKTINLSLTEPPAPKPAPAPAGAAGVGPASSPPEQARAEAPPEAPAPSDATEVARTLGRGLAELRKAREEVQRTFRVDLNDLPETPSRSGPATTEAQPTTETLPTSEAEPPAEAG